MDSNSYTKMWQVRIADALLVQLVDPLQHRKRSLKRALGIFLRAMSKRQPEDHHQAIADELIQKPAMVANHLIHRHYVSIEPAQYKGRRLIRTERCEPADVGKHHRRGMLFTAQ